MTERLLWSDEHAAALYRLLSFVLFGALHVEEDGVWR